MLVAKIVATMMRTALACCLGATPVLQTRLVDLPEQNAQAREAPKTVDMFPDGFSYDFGKVVPGREISSVRKTSVEHFRLAQRVG